MFVEIRIFNLFSACIIIVSITIAACDNNASTITTSEEADYQYFKTLATHSHGGLGASFVRHQMEKHGAWYHRKRHDRTKMFQSSKLQTSVNGKPAAPFNVNDISDDNREQMVRIGIGINMLRKAENYSDEVAQKSADSNVYLSMKLRPSKSEVLPVSKVTRTEIEKMLVKNGSTLFLHSMLRINPNNFQNLTENQIREIQAMRNSSALSQTITKLSENLTKPVLHNKLPDHKPVTLIIRHGNTGITIHDGPSFLSIITLLVMIWRI